MPLKRTRSQLVLSYWGKLLLVRKHQKLKDMSYYRILKRSPSVPATNDDFRNLREVYHFCDLPGKLRKKKMEEEMKRMSEFPSTSYSAYRAVPQSKPKKIKFSFKSFLNIFPKFKKLTGKFDKSKSIHPNKIHGVKSEACPEPPGPRTEGSPLHPGPRTEAGPLRPGPRTEASPGHLSFWSEPSLEYLGTWAEVSPEHPGPRTQISPEQLSFWSESSPEHSDPGTKASPEHPDPGAKASPEHNDHEGTHN